MRPADFRGTAQCGVPLPKTAPRCPHIATSTWQRHDPICSRVARTWHRDHVCEHARGKGPGRTGAWNAAGSLGQNARFSKAPALPVNVHRPLMDHENLDETFTWQEQRSPSAALTLQYDKVLFLVDPVRENQRLAGKRVTVVDRGCVKTIAQRAASLGSENWF
jgi:hypothetical protein